MQSLVDLVHVQDLPVSLCQIEGCDEFCAFNIVDEVIYSWHRVRVLLETALSRLQLKQRRIDPSFFLTGRMGLAQGLEDGSIIPACSISCSSWLMVSQYTCGRRYGGSLIGWALGVLMQCLMMLVLPGAGPKTSENLWKRT